MISAEESPQFEQQALDEQWKKKRGGLWEEKWGSLYPLLLKGDLRDSQYCGPPYGKRNPYHSHIFRDSYGASN